MCLDLLGSVVRIVRWNKNEFRQSTPASLVFHLQLGAKCFPVYVGNMESCVMAQALNVGLLVDCTGEHPSPTPVTVACAWCPA